MSELTEHGGGTISLSRFFPFLRWARPTVESMLRDAWAGLSVSLVLIPQALAYATLAGMPPQTGLYAALVPGLVGVFWGTSPLLAVGPVALTSLLVFGSLLPMAMPNSADWVVLAIWLSLYAGTIQLLLGAFRLGRIACLVSLPVVIGFTNAAAIIIVISQLPALCGIALSLAAITEPLAALRSSKGAAITTLFGGSALLCLLLLKRFVPRAPAILLVCVIGIGASWACDYSGHGGAIIGYIPAGLPPLSLPQAISFEQHQALWPAASIIALISFVEAISSCNVLARKTGKNWDENQELIGQGLAKISSALSGGFPVSASFSRSALNLYAGAVSAWSTIFAVLCVLFSLYFLMDYFYFMPRSVLAALIIVPVIGLIDLASIRRLLHISKDDGMIAIVTIGITLLSAPHLHWGVFAGIGLALVSFLYRRTHPRVIEVGHHEDGTLRDRNRFGLATIADDMLAVRIDSALNFLTGSLFERFIVDHCRRNKHVKRVLFCAGSVNDIDYSGIETLFALQSALQRDGIVLQLSAVKKQVWDVMERAGFISRLGEANIFLTDAQAIAAIRRGGQ